ncbi:LRR receptor-like serine/threonine-protein kinase ER2 isoform X2 [Physcomitrium patens]|nr:LRR receptor-like serine/threonine-protein kinase ERL2 isoform X3 [Physcomitrium patens]|eukprot:XP_024359517.1 LRR receptor-like serine/threonine-protein kinase ERL2 isoform X3 [Physcomitrella patens]
MLQLQQLEYLALGYNHLIGPIPSTFSSLTNLRHLDLQMNELSGPIPALIFWSESLQYLMLKGNYLTGSLSADMCQLTQLAYFNVRNNNLTGPIPDGIGNCTSFQILDLSYNGLSGVIPYNIGYLQVSTLSLEGNRFSGRIPEVLGLMQALVILDLSSNRLEGPIPPILGNLTSVTKLYLYNNRLTGSIPPELGNMTRLNYLELNNNELTGRIPSELGCLTDLFELKLSENELTGPLPGNISSLAALNLLDLHGNKLNGTILPELEKLTNLTNLNLSSNFFSGNIPNEVGLIFNLDKLDLSKNNLTGPIPRSIGRLEHLLYLDLHDNKLSGPIGVQVGTGNSTAHSYLECSHLNYLDLSHNALYGPIPIELGQLEEVNFIDFSFNNLSGPIPRQLNNCFNLKNLNLSYNNLSGEVPVSEVFARFPLSSYFGNPRLCLAINNLCGSTLPTGVSRTNGPLGATAAWGISISAICLLALLLFGAMRIMRPRDLLKMSKAPQGPPKLVTFHMGMAPQSFEEMMCLTENLSEKYVAGRGGSSTVYKCTLKNGHSIAIKKLFNYYPQNVREFETELKTLGNIKHRNVVSLRGYSMSSAGNFLFYDFMEYGSLYDHLHGHAKRSKKMDWNTRLKIALGSAQGLAYLHQDCTPQVIHRDVKSCNILLNANMDAHLCDFGLAKNIQPTRTHTSTFVLGTIGYIDPEYAQTSRLNEKSDVYSFGIVLLELLMGKKAVDDEVNLLDWVRSKIEQKNLLEFVDPYVRSTCPSMDHLEKALKLALLCAKQTPSQRPTMYDVAQVLSSLLPVVSPRKPPSYPSPGSKHRRYVDTYSAKPAEGMIASSSTSGGDLLDQFENVINSRNM